MTLTPDYVFGMASENNKLAVPTFLKQWRTFRRITQEALAAKVEMTPPSISQLETGNQGFTDKSLARIAAALDCTPADLLVHDPMRTDSFWPLCQAAEKLEGRDRARLLRTMQMHLDDAEGGSE
jgi:transcriptional regulator with XRE-family HTH domain